MSDCVKLTVKLTLMRPRRSASISLCDAGAVTISLDDSSELIPEASLQNDRNRIQIRKRAHVLVSEASIPIGAQIIVETRHGKVCKCYIHSAQTGAKLTNGEIAQHFDRFVYSQLIRTDLTA